MPAGGAGKGRQKALHLQRFAVGVQGRQPYMQAQPGRQFDEVGQLFGFEVAGEAVLHQNHAAGTVCGVQGSQCGGGGRLHLPSLQRWLQGQARQQWAVHHADAGFQQALHHPVAHDAVVQPGRMRQPRHGKFQRADQIIAQGPLVALVIELQKARPEVRHVHLDGTLPRTRFARQAAGHGLVHLVRKIGRAAPGRPRVLPAAAERAPEAGRIARQFQHIHAGMALQPQPFADQRGTALRGMHALPCGLP